MCANYEMSFATKNLACKRLNRQNLYINCIKSFSVQPPTVSCCYLVQQTTFSIILIHVFFNSSGFPLGLEKPENLEKWEGIFQSGKSQGILNRLEKSGKSQGKPHKILEN